MPSAWSRRQLEANRSSDIVEKSRTSGRRRPESAGDLEMDHAQEALMPTPSVEPPAVKLGGRGVWRVDRLQLDTYIERMHEQTADWARKHPLKGVLARPV